MTEFILPVIYGSIAFRLPSDVNRKDDATHRWVIYLRGVNGIDLSSVISKVVFKLHPSCEQPTVECTKYPYETTQYGWGEFPLMIKIYFRDEDVPPVVGNHFLKLFHTTTTSSSAFGGGSGGGGMSHHPESPVVKESYDEVVFRHLTPEKNGEFLKRLANLPTDPPVPAHNFTEYWTKTFPERGQLEAVEKAHIFVRGELERLEVELIRLDARLEEEKERARRGEGSGAAGANPANTTATAITTTTPGATETTA